MHIIPGPAVGLLEGNESFPFQNDILGYVYIHGNDRVTKLYVISGHASPVFHADFFPRLVKYDVTSQPANARKNNTPLAISGHSVMAISWIGMYLKSLLVPNAIQSCSKFGKP